jgi:hypothetical protein
MDLTDAGGSFNNALCWNILIVQANLRHAISPGQQVALQAQVAIPAGTELTIRYTHMLQPILRRRAQIEVCKIAARGYLALVQSLFGKLNSR